MALAEHLWGAPSHHIAKAKAPTHKQQVSICHVQFVIWRLVTRGGGGYLALRIIT